MGIPSDRILLPSERGDNTSFFQYMNPRSLAARVQTLESRRVGQLRKNVYHPQLTLIRDVRGAAEFCSSGDSVCSWPTAVKLLSVRRKARTLLHSPVRTSLHFGPQEVNQIEGLAACVFLRLKTLLRTRTELTQESAQNSGCPSLRGCAVKVWGLTV